MNIEQCKKRALIDERFFLTQNPEYLEFIQVMKDQASEKNKGLEPYIDDRYYCGTCGSQRNHPDSGICFDCDMDNWCPLDYQNDYTIPKQDSLSLQTNDLMLLAFYAEADGVPLQGWMGEDDQRSSDRLLHRGFITSEGDHSDRTITDLGKSHVEAICKLKTGEKS